ncbi:CHASE2 domain-containing protein [Chitinolyticbacter meiyuanensis]|uniref:CHASE2 domain-containing protein n=1 Tax=Chitinolyticbacter meiyuanensis TaxID=682798 RepID=UPI0011E5E9FD|nr:adenylate/guanylate cyclase domain-containing protein [Chitinolyticbacter meiyuanensis]
MRRPVHWPQWLLGLLVLLLVVALQLGVLPGRGLAALDDDLYDLRLRATAPGGIDPRVVIVDIDEKSLAALGRWPWRRDKLAGLVDALFARYGVKALGFDVVFAEPDESGLSRLRELAAGPLADVQGLAPALTRLASQLDTDAQFAASFRGRAVVTGFYFTGSAGERSSGVLPPAVLPAEALAGTAQTLTSANHYGGNLAVLQQAALAGGHFVPAIDADGVTRRVPLIARIGDHYYPALSLALVRAALGQPPLSPVVQSGGGQEMLEALRVGPMSLPTDARGWVVVPYRGEQGSFRYVSAIDVLEGKVEPGWLRQRIVLLGTSAPGLKDLRVTPVGEAYPGVEIHANLIAGMLDNALPQQPGYLLGAEFLLLVLLAPLATWLLVRHPPLTATALLLGLTLLAVGFNLWLWAAHRLDMPLAATLLLLGLLYIGNMAWGYVFEARRKRQLTRLFGQYVVPELVEQMSEDPEQYTMRGQSQQLTVLFTDVRNFTALSEGLSSEQLALFMNEFLTEISTVIRSRYLGTIDKYIGDCVMAFWGAPVFDPDHADKAVRAALDIQTAIAALNPRLVARGWPQILVGVGVNTGTVTVGDLGSRFRLTYTVMGDAVNLASRIEGLTKVYGVGVLVGEDTRTAAPQLSYREIDRVRVLGRDEAVTLYEPLPPNDAAAQDRAALFAEALRRYRAREWDLAELQLLQLQAAEPQSAVYALYLARISQWRAVPPAVDWDGVHSFEHK